ncbi:MAG: hypothetical protein ABEJ74_06380 [Haloferacaceae archaeon]
MIEPEGAPPERQTPDRTTPCTHCGQHGSTEGYTLRFAPDGRDARDLDLSLCRDCLATMLEDPVVDLVAPALVRLDDDWGVPGATPTGR